MPLRRPPSLPRHALDPPIRMGWLIFPAAEANSLISVALVQDRLGGIHATLIMAQVTRDRLMIAADKMWPHYGFAQHKGYGTAAHMAAIRRHGPCALHRRTFAPLKSWLAAEAAATATVAPEEAGPCT